MELRLLFPSIFLPTPGRFFYFFSPFSLSLSHTVIPNHGELRNSSPSSLNSLPFRSFFFFPDLQKMEEQTEILVPFEVQFSDLVSLASPSPSSPSLSSGEIARLESISSAIMQNLGPSGPGLLSIAGVPKADELRRNLLPLARKLALLGSKDRARILKVRAAIICFGSFYDSF